jgi:hypothetical protein
VEVRRDADSRGRLPTGKKIVVIHVIMAVLSNLLKVFQANRQNDLLNGLPIAMKRLMKKANQKGMDFSTVLQALVPGILNLQEE